MQNPLFIRLAAGLGAAVLAVSLAGCGGTTAPSGGTTPTSGDSTPTTAPETSAPETPTEQPPVADDVSTWIVSETGMGPITLGDDFAATLTKLPDWRNDKECSWTAFWNTPGNTMNLFFVRANDTDAGPVTVISVDRLETVKPEEGPHTTSGIGIGSTRDEVLAAYPDAVEQTSTIGEIPMLRVGEPGKSAMFFSFHADGPDIVSGIAVTSADEPPYEVCG